MLTDSTDILWAGERYVISQGETGLSSAGEYAAPSSSEQTDTHDTFRHSPPDSTLACRQNQRGHLSHAIRAENKDDEVQRTKKSWGSKRCNERWLEVEAPANELQRARETNSSWLGSLLKTLLDTIKADNDRQPVAERHDSKCAAWMCLCGRERESERTRLFVLNN